MLMIGKGTVKLAAEAVSCQPVFSAQFVALYDGMHRHRNEKYTPCKSNHCKGLSWCLLEDSNL
jgi:hypothetical protein